MRTSLIIFAIIAITGLSGVAGSAQEKGKARGSRQIVGGAGGAGSLAVTKRNQITVNTGSGNDTFRSGGIKDGTSNTIMSARSRSGRTETVDKNESITIGGGRTESVSNVHGGSLADGRYTRRANGVTFEGNDEPLWANRTSSKQVVQGNQIGTNLRPSRFFGSDGEVSDLSERQRTAITVGGAQSTTVGGKTRSITGDFDGDGDVDGGDFLLKSPAGKPTNVVNQNFALEKDETHTVGHDVKNKTASTQSLMASTYGRGRQNGVLIGLLIP